MTEFRALLLTDVVDSTQLSETLGDAAMAEVWTQHDRVARDLLPVWRGREIDKTDGMLLLFDAAADAVHYAQAYHLALAVLPVPLRARAGLHLGAVSLRENSADDVARGAKPLEVDGLAKPTAARIMSIAQGGQTLLSAQARAHLEQAGGPELQVESHGHWLVKGVSEPVEIFEVVLPGAPLAAPLDGDKVYRVIRSGERWLPVKEIANNLPQQGSLFIGREQELRDVKALLGSVRLVTLVGMGGLGKTRLSLQAAAELMHRFPDGVWFLDLAPISDPRLVLAEAAQLLGVREEPERTLLQSVCAYLKTRRVLLVLDNCEHLIQAAGELAHAIVKVAPNVRLAASSREALHVPGEHAYLIQPLPVPKLGDSVASLRQSTAVRLFVDRAQAHKAGFVLTDDLAPAVAELVARLEGIPLALELAAARVRSLSVTEINRRLGDRYKILTGGSRALQARQQTLRALVDWSYDLLHDVERTLFNRLATFKGGFEIAAVEAVCGADPLSADDILDLLTSLIEKSLVMTNESDDGTRYKMLETLRDYATEKLLASGEAVVAGAAHCRFFFDLAKQGRDGLRGPLQGEWLKRLETEHDNLRAAMALAQADLGLVDPMVAVKLAVALQNFWVLRGRATEGRAAVQALLALPALDGSDVARAHVLNLGAALAWSQGDPAAALADLTPCLALRRALNCSADHSVDLAATLSTMALARLSVGDAKGARAAALEALPLFRQAAHPVGEAAVLLQLGQVEFFLGQDESAREHLQAALALARRIKHPETEAEAELVLAQVAFESGDSAGAELGLARSLKQCLAAGDRRGAANALWWLGKVDLLAGRLALACARFGEALTAFSAFDMHEQLPDCLEDHAALALALQAPEAAVALASAAHQQRDKSPLVRSSRAQARGLVLLGRLRAACSEAEFNRAWQQAQGWEANQVLRQARGLLPASAVPRAQAA